MGTQTMVHKTAKPKSNKPKRGFMYYCKRDWQLYLLLVFPITMVIIFKYFPMAGLIIAFKDYKILKGFMGSEWVGFKNFVEIFSNKDFYRALRNTLTLNGLDLLFGFPMPIILAIMLNEIRTLWFKKVNQTLLYLPHFLSWVIIAGVAYQLFQPGTGMINILLRNAGLSEVPFLTENTHWIFSYVLIGVWQSMGWGSIIYLAAITGINPELYDSATIDGAGRWGKIRYVTLPGIRSTITIILIINLGRIMGSSFERANSLGNPIVKEVSSVIATYVYSAGIQAQKYSLTTAVGLFQSVVGLILVLISDWISKRIGDEGLL
ncbi:MAG TPA: ABC transporter permease subunit [Thermoclostridium sp.]